MRIVETKILNSDTGEVISEKVVYGVANGSGWVICYRRASEELALKCDSAITFKVFHLLISLQENFGSSGVVCSKKFLVDKLNVSRKSVYTALEWLINNDFIVETKSGGCSEFFFNPSKVTIGRDKTTRIKRYVEIKRLNLVKDICNANGLVFPLSGTITANDVLENYNFSTLSLSADFLSSLPPDSFVDSIPLEIVDSSDIEVLPKPDKD